MGDSLEFGHEATLWWPVADWKPADIDTRGMTKSEADKLQPIHPQLTILAESQKLLIIAALKTHASLSGYPHHHVKKITGDVLLVLGEIFNNVLFHAHEANPNKKLSLRWWIRQQVLEMIFKDSGQGFDVRAALEYDPTLPENLETPGRRGVMLITTYASQAEWSEGGTKITVRKNLSISPDTEPAEAVTAA